MPLTTPYLHHLLLCEQALALRAQHWVVILNLNHGDTADSVVQQLTTSQGLQELLKARKLQVRASTHFTELTDEAISQNVRLLGCHQSTYLSTITRGNYNCVVWYRKMMSQGRLLEVLIATWHGWMHV